MQFFKDGCFDFFLKVTSRRETTDHYIEAFCFDRLIDFLVILDIMR